MGARSAWGDSVSRGFLDASASGYLLNRAKNIRTFTYATDGPICTEHRNPRWLRFRSAASLRPRTLNEISPASSISVEPLMILLWASRSNRDLIGPRAVVTQHRR